MKYKIAKGLLGFACGLLLIAKRCYHTYPNDIDDAIDSILYARDTTP